jgi:penicillin-binding protein 1C
VVRDGATAAATGLDATVQRVVSDTLRRHLLGLQDRVVRDGAALVVDNASGDVLAYVGGAGDVSSAPYVDGVRARRQAGSALKPFLYAAAFAQRLLTPASLIEDAPLELAVAGGLYRPRNYDERFRGVVTARAALAASLNVPAVRVLGLVGADTFVGDLRQLGFTGLVDAGDYYGPALALGSADVTLWDLTNAYRVLANGGMWTPLHLAADGARGTAPRRVYDDAVAYLVTSILADRESRASTFGLDNPLATRFWTAVKTGTSKDMRDNWCVGFSQRYTVGVWVGNFSGAAMHDVSGVTGAAPVWSEIMTWLHAETPSVAMAAPPGVVVRDIAVGAVVGPEWFLDGTQPAQTTVERAAAVPRILAPADGTVMALDPDIGDPQQRVAFEADGATGAVRWVLDGTVLGVATGVTLWAPRPGRHRLELVDADARVRDRVEFVVRGGAASSPLSRMGAKG